MVLFNDAVSADSVPQRKDGLRITDWKAVKEVVVGLKEAKKATKFINQDSRFSDRGLNQELLPYEATVLQTCPLRSPQTADVFGRD
jgi:hypothetical protein